MEPRRKPRRPLSRQKEELVYLLALELVRLRGAGKGRGGGGRGVDLPPESWTEAKWSGEARQARIGEDGAAIVPLIRIRPR